MDLSYFLRERLKIIRLFLDEAPKPFEEIKRKIEAEEEPYVPGYFDPYGNEDPNEPPFQEDWERAGQTAEIIPMLAISLLSDSLKVYFGELERDFGLEFDPKSSRDKHFRKHGMVEGYRLILEHIMGDAFKDCPIRFGLIEQVVLARNRFHHGDDILTFKATHDRAMLTKHENPFFLSDEQFEFVEPQLPWKRLPEIVVTREKVLEALDEVERMGDWIWANDRAVQEWMRGPKPKKT